MSQQNDGRQHDDARQQHAGAIRPYHILVATTGEPRLAFSPDETAELLGISPELVYDLIRTRQLKSGKAGRRRLFSRVSIESFLAGDAA
jgi:excisionase family DNA binding protein